MKIQGILLDFNGTLFFDSPYHELAWKAISKELRGTELSDEELRDHMHGKNNEKVITYIVGKHIDPMENKKYSLKKEALYRDMCLKHPEEFHLASGVEAFLDTLVQEKIPFTIASASIKENIDFFVEHFHLDKWLDPSSIVYDDGNYETKVEMFQEAARRIHVNVEESLIIEDSVSGIQFARDVNAASILAVDSSNDPSKYEQFSCIDQIIKDFVDFPWKLYK